MSLDQLVQSLAPTFAAEFLKHPARPCRIFLSASDMKSRAITVHASHIDPADAFSDALDQLKIALGSTAPTVLRAEWVLDTHAETWGAVNHSDCGVALKPDFSSAITNLELASALEPLTLKPEEPVVAFSTVGVVATADGVVQVLDQSGHRRVTVDAVHLVDVAREGARYLARQITNSGRFIYGRLPLTDRFVPSYDPRHHFQAVRALLDVFELDPKDERLRTALERALKYGIDKFMRSSPEADELALNILRRCKGLLNVEQYADLTDESSDDSETAAQTPVADVAALLDAHFYPEVAMFFKRPDSIVGAFFVRDNDFRVRIDDAARAISSLVALSKSVKSSIELPVEQAVDQAEVDRIVGTVLKASVARTKKSPRGEAKIFYGGNLNLGRRMNYMPLNVEHFKDIRSMPAADLRIASLMCAVAGTGSSGGNKGGYYSYFRARPELADVLVEGDIDVVLTANHHAGDGGSDAVIDECRILDAAGIGRVGSGANLDEASRPIYVKANDLIVAIFSVNAVMKHSAAAVDRAGTWYLPFEQLEPWTTEFPDRISDARRHADLVFVAVDWEPLSGKRNFEQTQAIGRALIDAGADGVLGCDSYWFNRVEKYNERPIIYGAGVFLFDDSREVDTGCCTLTVDRDGVKRIRFEPLRRAGGKVWGAARESSRINEDFMTWSSELKNGAARSADGSIEIAFSPTPVETPRGTLEATTIFDPTVVEKRRTPPVLEPRPEWVVERVPDEAIISPFRFDSLRLVGFRVDPKSQSLTVRAPISVETYWTIDRAVEADCRILIEGKPVRECIMPIFGLGSDHDFIDWLFPVKRWTPGVIYHERFSVSPPPGNRLVNVDLRLEIKVQVNGKFLEPYVAPRLIEAKFKHKPWYRTTFPDIIYRSEFDKCWTAGQIEAVTGGKWLVPPPEGWFVQSVFHLAAHTDELRPPRLLATWTQEQINFHNNKSSVDAKGNSYRSVVANLDKLAGVIVDHKLENLPPDFPQLQVPDPLKAAVELGFAARQRFQGRMIGVTGTNGKTTTCAILKHVLGAIHSVEASYASVNTNLGCPITFASVNQEAAFAIIEISLNALAGSAPRGAITYDLPPDIAVVTSIFEVHFIGTNSLQTIAKAKLRIFNGMSAGSHAVLNRDMNFYEMFERRARELNLKVITFGTHPDSTIRMEKIVNGGTITINGRSYVLDCPVPNDQLYDALAVLGVSMASGVSIEYTLEQLKTFETVKGRGNLLKVEHGGKSLRVIDSTYNANIASIKGALKYLTELEPDSAKRVIVLGDVAELGTESERLHLELVEPILDAGADRVILVGEYMKLVWERIAERVRGAWYPTYKELIEGIDGQLRDGDTILMKSSHSTHLDHVVDHLEK